MTRPEQFSSRWGFILASLGMAVGAGNIWRFPRIVVQYPGGSFILAWLIALFLWSIPLLVVEFSFGRESRRGPAGAFARMLGAKWAWVGAFVALTTTAIMFYYSVVAGWSAGYMCFSATGGLEAGAVQARWQGFVDSPLAWAGMAASLAVGGLIVWRGVRGGIERACRVLIPLLFLLLVVAAARALTLEGAGKGVAKLFEVDLAALGNHRLWLEAFSQSAWSTGAGWGLYLVYATYTGKGENPLFNAFMTGVGNNLASLLAALATVPTLYALGTEAEIQEAVGGNEGLAFIYIPKLFLSGEVPGGKLVLLVFFVGLFLASLSSLIAMIELGVRTLLDFGGRRGSAVLLVVGAALVLGTPSAFSTDAFKNQDWAWGLGLLVTGLLFALGAVVYGAGRLRELVNRGQASWRLGRWFDGAVTVLIPLLFLAMLAWWFQQAVTWDEETWWHPFRTFSIGTCLGQWGIALLALRLGNRWLARSGR